MDNTCYIAAAGAGKTTHLINLSQIAIEEDSQNFIIIITLTTRNQENISERIAKLPYAIRKRIKVSGWYEFLLKYIIRPYKGDVIPELYERNVGMLWSQANQNIKKGNYHINRYAAGDIRNKYLHKDKIYKNYISEFAHECIRKNPNNSIERLSKIFTHIFIDESQDLAGYDYDLIKLFSKAPINLILVGDPRQHTYSSSDLKQHKKYKGKIEEFIKNEINTKRRSYILLDDTTLNVSHRCSSEICTTASILFPDMAATIPCTCKKCEEDKLRYLNGAHGVFWVKPNDIVSFVHKYNPVALTFDKTVVISPSIKERLNMGESKGLGFRSCLIYPAKPMLEFFKKRTPMTEITRSKLYVALTRATNIVGIVVPEKFNSDFESVKVWEED